MKKKSNNEMDDDLRPEYDFSRCELWRGVRSGRRQAKVIHLEPMWQEHSDDESVNEALRLLMRVATTQTERGHPSTVLVRVR